MSLMNQLEACASMTIGMVTNSVTVVSNVTKAAAVSSEVLVHHAEYYNALHLQHHATKTGELTEAISNQPKDIQDLIASFKAKGMS